MHVKRYEWQNAVIEVALGALPMAALLWISNDSSDFQQKVENYIPSPEIQLLFCCYLGFGLTLATLNLWFNLSKALLRPSFDFVSAFLSIGQVFAGILFFFTIHTSLHNAYNYTIRFAVGYYVFHFATINLSSFVDYQKQKR